MKKKWGDRKDAYLLRDIDPVHFIMPMLYPERCNNEAFLSERIDLSNAARYLEEKNRDNPPYKYNLFQLVIAAMLKVMVLRPKMNRFILNKNMYQHKDITASFVVKKIFDDNGGEALAFLTADENGNIDSIHEEIYKQVRFCRSDKLDSSSADMEFFQRLPRWVARLGVRIVLFLDHHDWVPKSVTASDPCHSSLVLSNLGSIGLHSGYHHLMNWGTNSLICVIGQRKKRPFYEEDGSMEMRDSVDLGLTIDERIADGYYFSRSIRLLRTLLEKPELLERPLKEEVEY